MTYVASRRPLRPHALPPLRPQRAQAAGDLARALAELRRRPPARDRAARSCAARSTSASRTSTSRTTTGRRTAPPRRTSAALRAGPRGRTATSWSISTKAGYDMWPGPYGEWGSRKYLLASLDQSLARMGSTTSTSSTRTASTRRRRSRRRWARSTRPCAQGKALYAGISSYSAEKTREAAAILRELGTPLLIHQPSYSMLNRWIEARPARRARRARASAASPSRRSRRGCSPTSTWTGSPRARARAGRRLALDQSCSPRRRCAKIRALDEIAQRPRPDARADGARLGAARPRA